jgi:hypothetical protein
LILPITKDEETIIDKQVDLTDVGNSGKPKNTEIVEISSATNVT